LLEQLEKIIIIKSQISKRNGPDHLFPMRSREGGNPNALGFSWAICSFRKIQVYKIKIKQRN